MNKFLKWIMAKIPENIYIFSNNTVNNFKNISNSEILVNKDSENRNHKLIIYNDLNGNGFYSGKRLDENIYQERFVTNKTENSDSEKLNFFLEDRIEGKNLIALFEEKNKICLLGNPGIGKTKELLNLFSNLWKSKEETKILPFFIDVRDFRKVTKFEDLFKFKNWKELDNIFLLLMELMKLQKFKISSLNLKIF